MLIIGSRAIKHYFPVFTRASKDIDFLCTQAEFDLAFNKFKELDLIVNAYPTSDHSYVIRLKPNPEFASIREYTIAYGESSDALILDYHSMFESDSPFVAKQILLLLKLSHRYKKNSPHFLKTMRDIQFLRSNGVALTDPILLDILKLREKETYNYEHPSLMQKKDNFFKKEDNFYVWDHDDIHKAVATLGKPAYLFFKPENSEVMVSKSMWDDCPLEVKLAAGREESQVLAIERSLVPHPGALTPKAAFEKALMKVCTSITSGWFREFCWENYDAIVASYNDDYFDRFNVAVAAGNVKRFEA